MISRRGRKSEIEKTVVSTERVSEGERKKDQFCAPKVRKKKYYEKRTE